MTVYKVKYKTFEAQPDLYSDGLDSDDYSINTKEKFFGTRESAEEFVTKRDTAAAELGLYPTLSSIIEEVDLE